MGSAFLIIVTIHIELDERVSMQVRLTMTSFSS